MATVEQITSLLEKRILNGDYALRQMPSEVVLAGELGASRMTARKALLRLVDRGLLVRQENGRIQPNRNVEKRDRKLQVAMLLPAWASFGTMRWQVAGTRAAERLGMLVRPIQYVHWDDVVIADALAGFDGVFLLPTAESMPDSVVERLRQSQSPVVMLWKDLSQWGIPSIDLCPPRFFQRLFDHLAELGHTRIDCLNTQPLDEDIKHRIEQWNLWRAAKGCDGHLYNHAVEPYQDPVRRAYEVVLRLIDTAQFDSKAIFCSTSPAAQGAIRAMYERGIRVGRDVSVTGADDEGWAWQVCPSLTVIQPPDPAPYLTVALEWMARGGREWTGPLLMQPSEVPLFAGESTGPAPQHGGRELLHAGERALR